MERNAMRLSDLDALVVKRLDTKIAFDTMTKGLERMEAKLAEAYRTAPGVSDPVDTDDPRYGDIVYEMRKIAGAENIEEAESQAWRYGYGVPGECRAFARHVRRRIRK